MPIWQIQIKTDETFNGLPNVLGIADNALVVGYGDNDRDHDNTMQKVLLICIKVNLKANKDKSHFRWFISPILVRSFPDMV